MRESFYAGGFFYNPVKKEVLLHQRDGNTKINPYRWAFFGGLNEGEETPTQTFIREIQEELGVQLQESEVIPLCDYFNEEQNEWRYVFYVVSEKLKSEMVLREGADFDWIPLEKVFEYDLSDKSDQDLRTFLSTL